MGKKMDFRLPVAYMLMVLTSPLAARVALDGNDFLKGSDAVNVIGDYTRLWKPGEKALLFVFDTALVAAQLKVRSVDNNGFPLLGSSANGLLEGSMMKYRFGAVTEFNIPGPIIRSVTGVLWLDYFVASHLDNFWLLFSPFEGGGFPVAGIFTGGKSTGFGAVAGQFLFGGEISLITKDFRVGAFLFSKFRDPINADGLFLSTHVDENYTLQYRGDYSGTNRIPTGIAGYSIIEPWFTASLYGFRLNSLFRSDWGLAFLDLAQSLDKTDLAKLDDIPVLAFLPAVLDKVSMSLAYVSSLYNFFRPSDDWKARLSFALPAGIFRFSPYADLSFQPFAANDLRLEAEISLGGKPAEEGGILFSGAIGYLERTNREPAVGWKFMLKAEGTEGGTHSVVSFTVSRNYGEQMIAGLAVQDEVFSHLSVSISAGPEIFRGGR